MPSISRYFSNRTTLVGFSVVIGLCMAVVVILLLQLDTWSRMGFELIRNNIQQTQYLISMRDAVQKRVMVVQQMISIPGQFDRDEISLRYFSLAAVYSEARLHLTQTDLDAALRDNLNKLDQAVAYAEPFYNNMVEALVYEDMSRADMEAIFREGNKASEKVLFMLDRIVRLQAERHKDVIQNYEMSRRYTMLGVVGVFVLILVVVTFAVRASSRQFSHVSRLTIVDELTGIYNRRYFDMVLDEEWKRSMREYSSISMLMIDIDYFKDFNDAYGHQQGDDCLKQVATILSSQVKRASDFCARYGGEEFVIVLPNTTAEHARLLAERIRRAIEDARIRAGADHASLWVTVSIGVATTTAEFEQSSSELVKAADNCLYQSKHNGRNRVSECTLEKLD